MLAQKSLFGELYFAKLFMLAALQFDRYSTVIFVWLKNVEKSVKQPYMAKIKRICRKETIKEVKTMIILCKRVRF